MFLLLSLPCPSLRLCLFSVILGDTPLSYPPKTFASKQDLSHFSFHSWHSGYRKRSIFFTLPVLVLVGHKSFMREVFGYNLYGLVYHTSQSTEVYSLKILGKNIAGLPWWRSG